MAKNLKDFECSYFLLHLVRLLSKSISKEMSVKMFCLYLTTDLLQTFPKHKKPIVNDPWAIYNPRQGHLSQITDFFYSAILTNFTLYEGTILMIFLVRLVLSSKYEQRICPFLKERILSPTDSMS